MHSAYLCGRMIKMTKIKSFFSGIAVNIIGSVVLMLILFGVVVSALGYISFTRAFKNEYTNSTYHMADTATTLVNGDNIDAYLDGKETEEYAKTKGYLDAYCRKMGLSLLYVIKVDTSDYGRFVSVFDSINEEVDNSGYTEWGIGYKRDTTNDEYRQKYKLLYEKDKLYETIYRINLNDGHYPHVTTLVPVKDSKGEVVSILCLQRSISELHRARKPYLVNIAIWTVFLAFFSALSAAVYIRRQFVRPIQKVSDEAVRFAKENTKDEELGKVSKYREISDLARSIDTMESDMVKYIDHLTAITAEKERIGAELTLAGRIQESSIPNEYPAFPDRSEFDIYGSMTPAKTVSGDFYNFFLVDEDHLAIVMGDVSGKGVPAALFMMVTNIAISNRAQMGGTPAEILDFVNNVICGHNSQDMFVTIWMGILEISTGRVTACNAGHDDAAVCRRNGSFELFKTKHNLVVGAMPGVRYRNFEISLEKGDKLFLYTDGVPEASDKNYNMFGMERMLGSLNAHKNKTPQEILEGISCSVSEFSGDAPQFDDLTMLCLELKQNSEEKQPAGT